jgi:hypothetical protein
MPLTVSQCILLYEQVLFSPSSVTVPNAFFVACSSWEDPPDEPLLSELSRYVYEKKEKKRTHIWICMCICICIHVKIYIYVYIYISEFKSAFLFVYMDLFINMHLYITFLYLYLCISYVGYFVCIRVLTKVGGGL